MTVRDLSRMETGVRPSMRRNRNKDRLCSGTGVSRTRSRDPARQEPEGVFRAPLPGEHPDKLLSAAKLSITDTADFAVRHDAGIVA